jgi:hypothetical protein
MGSPWSESDFLTEASRSGGGASRTAHVELLAALKVVPDVRVAFDGAGLERVGYNVYVSNVPLPVLRVFGDGEIQASGGSFSRAGRPELGDVFERELPYLSKDHDYRSPKVLKGSLRIDEVDLRAVTCAIGFVARHAAAVWQIGREGRAWRGPEARARFELMPEKIEMTDGNVFCDDQQRVTALALLLEKRRHRPRRSARLPRGVARSDREVD